MKKVLIRNSKAENLYYEVVETSDTEKFEIALRKYEARCVGSGLHSLDMNDYLKSLGIKTKTIAFECGSHSWGWNNLPENFDSETADLYIEICC